jgi:type IV fimbrial biogenesis protein FimT
MELMVSLAVLGVLLGFAVPSFREFTRQNRVTAAQNDLATAINLARNEALKRSGSASICASSDGVSCGSVNDWRSGWIVFSDMSGTPGALDVPGDEVLQRWSGVDPDLRFTISPGASGVGNVITFRGDGANALEESVRVEIRSGSCTGKRRLRTTVLASGSIQATKEDC